MEQVFAVTVREKEARPALDRIVERRNEAIRSQVEAQRRSREVLAKGAQIEEQLRQKARAKLQLHDKKATEVMQKRHDQFKKRMTAMREVYNRRHDDALQLLKSKNRDIEQRYVDKRVQDAKFREANAVKLANTLNFEQLVRHELRSSAVKKADKIRMRESLYSKGAEQRVQKSLSEAAKQHAKLEKEGLQRFVDIRSNLFHKEIKTYQRFCDLQEKKLKRLVNRSAGRQQALSLWEVTTEKKQQKELQQKLKVEEQHDKLVNTRRSEHVKKELALLHDCTKKLSVCGVETNPEELLYGSTVSMGSKPGRYSMTTQQFFKKRKSVWEHVRNTQEQLYQEQVQRSDRLSHEHALITGMVNGLSTMRSQFQDRLGHSLVLSRRQ